MFIEIYTCSLQKEWFEWSLSKKSENSLLKEWNFHSEMSKISLLLELNFPSWQSEIHSFWVKHLSLWEGVNFLLFCI